ncbi:threonine synthase [Clostridium sp.]|uniref:threonine synthase n=1 Tax=Clostridium sp. TaxID=1506 RepID=UPI003F390570
MNFMSTRGGEKDISPSMAIVNGIAKDGGLYVPDKFPKIYESLKKYINVDYETLAYEIISEFFTDFTKADLMGAINEAYKDRFKVELTDNYLELYHGPTAAFKDAALLFLPQIMKRAKKVCNVKKQIVILTATSGDTGKAALEGFKDIEGFKILVYYPRDGVSAIQERQMVTQKGNNLKVISIKGNFDNAQTGVKNIFNNKKLKEELEEQGYILSSANSINIGRLIPQIVYYFYGYFNLVNKQKIKEGDKINVVVPTGNFGNILAAYYAREMGLPIARFICASNENNVLTDFFNKGVYDKRRELILTTSPSMDILVSSNLERLLFEATKRDVNKVEKMMESLNKDGVYKIEEDEKEFLSAFYGNFASEEEVNKAIKETFEKDNYLMDTHTAVAQVVLSKYLKEVKDDKVNLIVSTANPYKFSRSICKALDIDDTKIDDFKVLNKLKEYSKIDIPTSLRFLENMDILHCTTCEVSEMADELVSFLKENL